MKLERVERLNLTLSAGAVAATWAFASPHVASSLALGAALEAMNFGALYRSAQIYLGGGVRGAGPWLAVFSTRFVLLAAGILIAVHWGAHAVALMCGLSIAIVAVVIDAWFHRPEFDPAQAAEWAVPPPDDESWDRYSIWRPWELETAKEEDENDEGQAAESDERATIMADAASALADTVSVDLTALEEERERRASKAGNETGK